MYRHVEEASPFSPLQVLEKENAKLISQLNSLRAMVVSSAKQKQLKQEEQAVKVKEEQGQQRPESQPL